MPHQMTLRIYDSRKHFYLQSQQFLRLPSVCHSRHYAAYILRCKGSMPEGCQGSASQTLRRSNACAPKPWQTICCFQAICGTEVQQPKSRPCAYRAEIVQKAWSAMSIRCISHLQVLSRTGRPVPCATACLAPAGAQCQRGRHHLCTLLCPQDLPAQGALSGRLQQASPRLLG